MDSISKQIIRSHQFFPKVAVGALLLFSIVGVPFFLGYLVRYLRQIQSSGDYTLPVWNHWLALLVESWEFILIVLIYGLIPCLLFALTSSTIGSFLGWFWPLAWLPSTFALLLSPIVISLALYEFFRSDTLSGIFKWNRMLEYFHKAPVPLILQSFLLWGFLFVGFPVLWLTVAFTSVLYLPLSLTTLDDAR